MTKKAKPIAATRAEQKERAETKPRTPEEQRAEIKRVAHEHGADLSEEGFNEALGKVARHKGRKDA